MASFRRTGKAGPPDSLIVQSEIEVMVRTTPGIPGFWKEGSEAKSENRFEFSACNCLRRRYRDTQGYLVRCEQTARRTAHLDPPHCSPLSILRVICNLSLRPQLFQRSEVPSTVPAYVFVRIPFTTKPEKRQWLRIPRMLGADW